MSKTIVLVAVDFSEASTLALSHARKLAARAPEYEVHVVHVLPPFVGPSSLEPFVLRSGSPVVGQPLAEAQAKLAELCAQDTGLRLTAHVRVGAPDREIVALARELDADFVVVGSHGRRGIERLVLGSVAELVVRSAPCVVVVARPKEAVGPAIEPPCPDCVAARTAAGDPTVWCARHAEHHVRAHTYAERESGSFTGPSFRFGDGS